MSETNMPAKQRPKNVLAILQGDEMKQEWARVLPSILTPDRMARVAVTQVRKVPKLQQCNQGSLFGALMTCAELGLEPNGRHAHLIPYGKECQLIIDYKGLVELAMRSGKVSRIHADVVCENDHISIENGIISHKVNPLTDRGNMVGAYAICTFKDGTEKHEFMSKKEVDSIRSRSRAGKAGPWVTDYNEMAKKTVFRRMSKWLPLSPEVHETISKEDDVLNNGSLPAKFADDIIEESPIESGALLGQEPEGDQKATAAEVPAEEVTPAQQTTDEAENEPEPNPEGIDYDKLTKAACMAGIENHKDAAYYAPILDEELGAGAEPKGFAVSVLRDVLKRLNQEAEKEA